MPIPGAMAGQGTRAAMAEQGAWVAMVDPGTQEAMAERGAWVAMVDPGTQEAMAERGAWVAMMDRGAWVASMAGSPPPKFSSRSVELDGTSGNDGELDRTSGEAGGRCLGAGTGGHLRGVGIGAGLHLIPSYATNKPRGT